MRRLIILVPLAVALLPTTVLAQKYGEGVYGASTYGDGVIQIGPIILPVTGAGLIGLVGSALLIAVGLTILVWRRHKTAAKK